MAQTSRRAVLVIGTAGVAGLAGCQVYGRPEEAAAPPPPASELAPTPEVELTPDTGPTPDLTPDAAGSPESGASQPLVNAGEVAVGGGVILADQNLVITQPVEGEFRAFSATCTHQGCAVSEVAGGTINCNCHGSSFAIADGSVVAGPAGRPLPATEIVVDGGTIGLQ